MKFTDKLLRQLDASLSPYHAVDVAMKELENKGFKRLNEGCVWQLEAGCHYYVVKDGSALIAFVAAQNAKGFNIVASHTDSPCLKLKYNGIIRQGNYSKLNVERYGGLLQYTFLDTPLSIAGRVVQNKGGEIKASLYASDKQVVIPSLAVHLNRDANTSLSLNAQNELMPLLSLEENFSLPLPEGVCDYDLFLANAVKPRTVGFNDEFILSPRIDNLSSVFSSIEAICSCNPTALPVVYLADNEEVGSRTKQGAASTFLARTLAKIAKCCEGDLDLMLSNSFIVSADNAHASHPNYPAKNDPTNNVVMGKGVVIKHHANQNYTTDALSSALISSLAQQNKIDVQHFFMRSDLQCGGTLGAISSSQVSVRSVDIGMPQLAMHSACETAAASDYESMVRLLRAFLDCSIEQPDYFTIKVK